MADERSISHGLRLAGPALFDREEGQTEVTSWSVIPEEYGDFLLSICKEWVRHDVGKIFVMNFEWVLNTWIGNPSPVCIHAEQFGRSVVLEHNGDVYACDHCVYPSYRLGNIMTDSLSQMVENSLLKAMTTLLENGLPASYVMDAVKGPLVIKLDEK